jgi:hypothetical protein
MNDDRWIAVNPVIFQRRGYVPKQDHVFIIMPFGPRWSRIVWETIRSTIIDLQFKCIRADEQYGHQILEDLWQGICEAAIVIADVTGRNPNVYYELGIAHVLGRRVILLTQDSGDIPFDIHIYRHVPYKVPLWPWARKREMRKLSEEIRKTVEWITTNEILPTTGPLSDAYAALRNFQTYGEHAAAEIQETQGLIAEIEQDLRET